MFGPIKNFIFDLDGTLIDSMGSAFEGFVGLLEDKYSLKIGRQDLVPHLGKSPRDIFSVWLKEEQHLNEMMKIWDDWCAEIKIEKVPAFDGVHELLELLHEKNLNKFIYTGRDRKGAIAFLKLHGWWNKYFNEETLYAGDQGFAPKPSPEALHHLMEKFKLNHDETLFTGDSEKDVIAGNAAGIKTAAALWDLAPFEGKTHRMRFKNAWQMWDQYSPDLRLSSPRELISWIK
jgi:phosphoglycolate phosphatase-like HAD superfamily hydrolase